MELFQRVRAEIDLDAIAENVQNMSEHINQKTQIIAVVKADAYGHGATPVAQLLAAYDYIWGFGVATAEEALSLRNSSITKPILILGYVFEEHYDLLTDQEIELVVFNYSMAQKMSEAAVRIGKSLKIHIAVDTGMTRIGFSDQESSGEIIREISKLPGLKLAGLFTHFAKADELDKTFSNTQLLRYEKFSAMLQAAGIEIPLHHCANSAGMLELAAAHMDVVRVGISLYGIYPSGEVSRNTVELKAAMSLKSRIIRIEEVAAGVPVSYGGTYVTDTRKRIATIPVGYGDGYPRNLSNRGWVLIHGKKAPILGRICMDQFMVDVTGIPEAAELDEVVLMGVSQGECLSVDTLSEQSGRFPYEFVCMLSKRIPRIYLQDKKVIATRAYFNE